MLLYRCDQGSHLVDVALSFCTMSLYVLAAGSGSKGPPTLCCMTDRSNDRILNSLCADGLVVYTQQQCNIYTAFRGDTRVADVMCVCVSCPAPPLKFADEVYAALRTAPPPPPVAGVITTTTPRLLGNGFSDQFFCCCRCRCFRFCKEIRIITCGSKKAAIGQNHHHQARWLP